MAIIERLFLWMEGCGDKSHITNSNETTSRPSLKQTQKRSLANYVDSIKEGLKKFGDLHHEIAKPKRNVTDIIKEDTTAQYSELPDAKLTKKNIRDKRKRNNSSKFENFHNDVPHLNSVKRTHLWLRQSDLSSDSKVSLSHLPIRGTLLPHKCKDYDDDDGDGDAITQVSSCESARGTHGRGTPPYMDPNTPRLDQLFQQLQCKQEREARKQMIANGESHLLSFNLFDVYSHQVAGMPMGTTPEILPFMSAPPPVPVAPRPLEYEKLTHQLEETSCSYPCKWSDCSRQFDCSESLFAHVDHCHLQAYSKNTFSCRIVCKWDNCNRVYYARYKLLLHVHNSHCKDIPVVATIRPHKQQSVSCNYLN